MNKIFSYFLGRSCVPKLLFHDHKAWNPVLNSFPCMYSRIVMQSIKGLREKQIPMEKNKAHKPTISGLPFSEKYAGN